MSATSRARLYKEAPLRRRPADLLSLVASRSTYSRSYIDSLSARGESVWHNSTTLTASYSMRVSAGNYLNVGVGYVYGPAGHAQGLEPVEADSQLDRLLLGLPGTAQRPTPGPPGLDRPARQLLQ